MEFYQRILRMLLRGYGEVAVWYTLGYCQGEPAYQVAYNLRYVGKKSFALPEAFYDNLKYVKTVDQLEYMLYYWSDIFAHREVWK